MPTRKGDPHDRPPTGAHQRGDWSTDAMCLGFNSRLFFPERGDSTRKAKAICAACHVQRQCLAYAYRSRQPIGIWGGKAIGYKARNRT